MDSLFTLDTFSGVRLSFLAEGAANIVYRPIPPPATPSTEADATPDQVNGALPATPPPTEISSVRLDPRLEGKLIRLRKNLSTTVPVTESWDHFRNVVSPLFSENQLVSQTLFQISRDVVRECNAELQCMEKDGRRSQSRHGLYLAEDEKYGTLIDDMTSDDSSMTIEFKPKWLAQSPSAPAKSKRCRTCALRAMKQAKAGRREIREGEAMKRGFCPLSLVSGDRMTVATVVEQLMDSWIYSDLDRMRIGDKLISWVERSSLLQRLKELQEELDPVGVLEADLQSPDFLTAMTLRDCTLFLKVRRHGDHSVHADT